LIEVATTTIQHTPGIFQFARKSWYYRSDSGCTVA